MKRAKKIPPNGQLLGFYKSMAYVEKANSSNTFLIIMLTICFAAIILLSSLFAMVYDRSFYSSEYEKNGVYEKYGENVTNAVTDNIFSFFRGKQDIGAGIDSNKELGINESFYTYNEKSHMYDVKQRIGWAYIVYYVSIALAILFFILLYLKSFDFLSDIGKVFLFSGIAVIFLVINLYFGNFNMLFELLHKLLFTGNYTFDQSSNLIGFFPIRFFAEFSYRVFFYSFIKAAFFVVSGIILIVSHSFFHSRQKPYHKLP